MNKKDLTLLLAEYGLTKKSFSGLSDENYDTVLGWGRSHTIKTIDKNKKEKIITRKIKIPKWINSWLDNYEKANKYKEFLKLTKG
ncbi:MAG: hypothetical protein DRG78_01455 [Epsilonproteobacteria bacterium]|nr:MAG: hypothetical protein DRG78_01455 [Campylobacterota bacterium]